MDIVNYSKEIWEYQNIFENVDYLLSGVMSGQWNDYTNIGGGNTIIGASTGLSPDSPYYDKILNIFINCYSDYMLKNNIYIPLDGLDAMVIDGRDWLEQKYFTIRRYDAGSIMHPHEDFGVPLRPKYTALFYFNDDYAGGELHFPKEKISIKPKSGSVIIFPSTTVHEVKLVESGKRYLTSCYLYERDSNAKI